jgi:hypothetical protein
MIDIYVVWPTVNIDKSKEMIGFWKEWGYKVSILVNPPHKHTDLKEADRVIVQNKWEGFTKAANILCRETPGDIIVVVGDDIYPDPNKTAQEIGEDFIKRFPDLNGVMQPIGDKYGWTHKCAVSPWIGRKFIETSYNGKGPYWEEYYHYFSDQELQEYASNLGAFEQREALTQYHDHWQRKENAKRPSYLMEAKRQWDKDQRLFKQRLIKGFPSE